jgi:MFS family permease
MHPDTRRTRIAVSTLFFVTGATFATWAARVPALQESAGLTSGELGVALAGLMTGAFLGLPLGGAVAVRLGSRRLLVAALVVFVPVLAALPFAAGLATMTALLVVFGAANSGVDIGVNVQGAQIERGLGRPVLSSLHALFSVGALTAAGIAAAVAAAGVPVSVHFAAAAAFLCALSLPAVARVSSEPRAVAERPRLAVPTRALALPGAIAFCVVVAEDVANTWSAVYLRQEAETGAALAAGGFALYSLGMLIGRLAADAVVRARGRAFVLSAGGLIASAGIGFALAVPKPLSAGVGIFVLGLGLAPAFPVLFGAVAHHDPPRAGQAIAAVTTVGYLGSVVGPPAVGALAGPFGLRAGLAIVPAATIAATLLVTRLRRGL